MELIKLARLVQLDDAKCTMYFDSSKENTFLGKYEANSSMFCMTEKWSLAQAIAVPFDTVAATVTFNMHTNIQIQRNKQVKSICLFRTTNLVSHTHTHTSAYDHRRCRRCGAHIHTRNI